MKTGDPCQASAALASRRPLSLCEIMLSVATCAAKFNAACCCTPRLSTLLQQLERVVIGRRRIETFDRRQRGLAPLVEIGYPGNHAPHRPPLKFRPQLVEAETSARAVRIETLQVVLQQLALRPAPVLDAQRAHQEIRQVAPGMCPGH